MNEVVTRQEMKAWDDRPAPVITEQTAMIQMIERMAMNPEINIERVAQLISMQERMEERQFLRASKLAYDKAFSEMQGELPILEERGKHSGTGSTYAKFDDLNEAVKPVLKKHGFYLKFRIKQDTAKVIVTGILGHKEGYSEEAQIELPVDTGGQKNNVQAIGSSIKYGERYTAGALLSLSSRKSEDDNGDRGGGIVPISEEQFGELRKLMLEARTNEVKFLELFKIDALTDLPASKFPKAVDELKAAIEWQRKSKEKAK